MSKLYLFGASGHGKVIHDIVLNLGMSVHAFIDDFPKNDTIFDTPVKNTHEVNFENNDRVLISIGDNRIRQRISVDNKFNYESIIDKTAFVSKFSKLQEGTVVMPKAIVNASTNIGKHVILNTGAVIEHDCVIEDYVHVSPNATITGGVNIGKGTHVGAGAIVIPNIKIGSWVTIGAGAVIIQDIPDNAVVVGNPGRVIKIKSNE